MTPAERVRLCILAEKIRENKEFAEKLGVVDKSHFVDDTKKEENNK